MDLLFHEIFTVVNNCHIILKFLDVPLIPVKWSLICLLIQTLPRLRLIRICLSWVLKDLHASLVGRFFGFFFRSLFIGHAGCILTRFKKRTIRNPIVTEVVLHLLLLLLILYTLIIICIRLLRCTHSQVLFGYTFFWITFGITRIVLRHIDILRPCHAL